MDNQTSQDYDKKYTTSDLNIVAFLIAKGCTYTGARTSQDDRRIVFVDFLAPAKCEKLEHEYFYSNPKVEVKSFVNALQQAKDVIFREKRRTV